MQETIWGSCQMLRIRFIIRDKPLERISTTWSSSII